MCHGSQCGLSSLKMVLWSLGRLASEVCWPCQERNWSWEGRIKGKDLTQMQTAARRLWWLCGTGCLSAPAGMAWPLHLRRAQGVGYSSLEPFHSETQLEVFIAISEWMKEGSELWVWTHRSLWMTQLEGGPNSWPPPNPGKLKPKP